MSDQITLTLRGTIDQRVEGDVITPDRLAALSSGEIERLPIWLSRPVSREPSHHVRRTLALGEVFSVRGERAADVRILGDVSAVDGLGSGMASGTLAIEGNAGRDVGRGMTGGTIAVRGSAGDGLGLAMAGGSIWVSEHAGHRVGGAFPGASRGMTGGEIVVRHSVGQDAGAGARRGLIVVGADAGDGAARGMIAGTILVLGRATGTVGLWNKRGTVVTLGGATVPPTYRYACTYRPSYLRVVFGYLRRAHGVQIEDRFVTGRYARYCGDLSELGKGELLMWSPA